MSFAVPLRDCLIASELAELAKIGIPEESLLTNVIDDEVCTICGFGFCILGDKEIQLKELQIAGIKNEKIK